MLTFQEIYEEAQDQVQDDDATSLVLIKRAINQGMQKFGAILNREWRVVERTFSTAADQQYYQLPEDCIRPKTIVITIGGTDYPLTECADEDEWNYLNSERSSERNDFPELYHVKGADQFGIFPIPSSSNASAGTITYESRMRRMSAADYSAGTVLVTINSQAVVGTGTTFTAQMVGRVLVVEDAGDNNGIPYKISGFTDATHITLENYYAGLTGSGKSYRIGDMPDIPEEFHESLIDYALYRYYRRRRDRGAAADAKGAFDEALVLCRDSYSSMSASQYVRASRRNRPLYAYKRRDLKIT